MKDTRRGPCRVECYQGNRWVVMSEHDSADDARIVYDAIVATRRRCRIVIMGKREYEKQVMSDYETR
jgi:hypothetical protein